MQITQLKAYRTKVPKFEASVMVSKLLGSAASLSCERYPKLDQNPCGKAAMTESAGALASPNTVARARQPNTAELPAKVQMARCGERFLSCRSPKCSGTSSSLPMAYVTRAPVFMQESVVPTIARNTVKAWNSMNVRPCPWPNNASPTTIIMSPMGAAEPEALTMV